MPCINCTLSYTLWRDVIYEHCPRTDVKETNLLWIVRQSFQSRLHIAKRITLIVLLLQVYTEQKGIKNRRIYNCVKLISAAYSVLYRKSRTYIIFSQLLVGRTKRKDVLMFSRAINFFVIIIIIFFNGRCRLSIGEE